MGEPILTSSAASGHHLSVEAMTEEALDRIFYLETSSFLTPWSKESFLNAVRDPNGINLVCRLGGDLIGYITSFIVLDEVYITNLLVAADYRRKGYGSTFLMQFMKRVKEKKGRHIFLEVRESNTGAITFYQKLGFQLVGVRKKYYSDTREDALVMKISFGSE